MKAVILLVFDFLLDHDAKGTRVNLCYLLLVVIPCGTSVVVYTVRSHLLGWSNVLFNGVNIFVLFSPAQKDSGNVVRV